MSSVSHFLCFYKPHLDFFLGNSAASRLCYDSSRQALPHLCTSLHSSGLISATLRNKNSLTEFEVKLQWYEYYIMAEEVQIGLAGGAPTDTLNVT